MRFLAVYGFLLLLCGQAKAQQLSASSSAKSILVGQEITLKYRVTAKKGDSISFNPAIGEIPSKSVGGGNLQQDGTLFEIIKDFHDSVITKGSKIQWIGEYVVTAWDSGAFVIPGPQIVIDDSVMKFQDLTISCDLVAKDDKIDLYDIRENYADIPAEPSALLTFVKSNWWWMTLILVVMALYIFIRRRNKEDDDEPEQRISLKQRALYAIEALEKEKLWEKDKMKEHFVELSYILRSYLTARYSISLLEKTTRQTKLLLKQKGLEDDTIDVINRILSQSDLVKFAKSKPETIDILKISAMAKQIIAETSPLEIEDAE